jgi:seryl-tRNA synthetase
MLEQKALREKTEEIRSKLEKRGDLTAMGFDKVVLLATQRRDTIIKRDQTKAEQNKLGEGMKDKTLTKEKRAELQAQLKQLADQGKAFEQEVKDIEVQLDELNYRLPNLPHDSVPVGKDEHDNQQVRTWGEPTTFSFTPKTHWELGEALGILDFESARKISGARFVTMRREAARLERAIAQFMLDLHTSRGYEEINPPIIVSRDSMTCTGQLPKFEEDAFKLAGNGDWFLIPTAEVPLVNLHRDDIIPSEQLPIKYCAFTPCFRAEAGSAGRDTRGMIRMHQFEKVELVQLTTPEASYAAHEALTNDAEEVLKRLGLPYRVMLLCTGDMGFGSTKTYDLEVWLPGQNAYREISSCSNCEDFQARRGMIRYKTGPDAKPQLVHTLNGSGLAVGRTFIAVIENYQQADGSIIIPEALRPYMGGLEKIVPR